MERIELEHAQDLSGDHIYDREIVKYDNVTSKEVSPKLDKPPIWSVKEKRSCRRTDISEIDATTVSKFSEKVRSKTNKQKRSKKEPKITKQRSSSFKRRKRSLSAKSIRSTKSKSREQQINESVSRVKNLAEKCISSIVGTSKVGLKSIRIKNKIKDKYNLYSKSKKKISKADEKLTKLEKMYVELSAMENQK